MEPFENRELTDQELAGLLREWRTPMAPERLRAAIFRAPSGPWWTRLWKTSILVPVPVAVCIAALLIAGAWRWVNPQRVEIPVGISKHVEYREGAQALTFRELRPVAELRPRIIRSKHAEN